MSLKIFHSSAIIRQRWKCQTYSTYTVVCQAKHTFSPQEVFTWLRHRVFILILVDLNLSKSKSVSKEHSGEKWQLSQNICKRNVSPLQVQSKVLIHGHRKWFEIDYLPAGYISVICGRCGFVDKQYTIGSCDRQFHGLNPLHAYIVEKRLHKQMFVNVEEECDNSTAETMLSGACFGCAV